MFVFKALQGKVCPNASKKTKTSSAKHQLVCANAMRKHKNLQYVKELQSVFSCKNL